jgi:hypothetical protein
VVVVVSLILQEVHLVVLEEGAMARVVKVTTVQLVQLTPVVVAVVVMLLVVAVLL